MSARAALPFHDSAANPPVEWNLLDLFAILNRRRAWIHSSLALCIGLAALYWACATPHFKATAVIEIQKESHGAFGLDNTTSDQQSTPISDSFDDNLTLQTEIGILESDALTLDVIRRTGLENSPDYFAPHHGVFPALRKLLFWRRPLEPLSTSLAIAKSPPTRAPVLSPSIIPIPIPRAPPLSSTRWSRRSPTTASSRAPPPPRSPHRGSPRSSPDSGSRPMLSTPAPPRSIAPPATTATTTPTIPFLRASTPSTPLSPLPSPAASCVRPSGAPSKTAIPK
jgi:hypothetical protein